tara:strand:- start:257 stop:547 length:291 start_codon:yes stop_codon:yes gene_type:complete
MNKEDLTTMQSMRRFGGSFCQRLADCFAAADPQNKKRLKACFAQEFQRYGKAGEFYWLILEEENKREAGCLEAWRNVAKADTSQLMQELINRPPGQ